MLKAMNFFSPLYHLPATLVSLLSFLACDGIPGQEPPAVPVSQRVTWDGHPPLSYAVDSGQSLTVKDSMDGITRIHTLEFRSMDSLRLILTEFPKDYLAYRAFQEKAAPAEIREGFFRDKNSLIFIHGSFLGELRYERSGLIPASFLKERLAFAGEELFRRPDIFKSFPLSGQFPFSERIVSSEFLGPFGAESVFIMRYQCHGDTATLFRAFPPFQLAPRSWIGLWKGQTDTLKWSGDFHFSGVQDLKQPLIFWIFKGGFLGVSGCYDRNLSLEYAEKMKKMAVLLNKP